MGGVPEVVRDGETGFLLPLGDLDGMAAHVIALLDDPARHERMARAAREDAVRRFQLGPSVDRYEALYHRVLGR